MKNKPIVPAYLVALVEDALQAARMESFGLMDDNETKTVVEGSRLFRETWLIPSLLDALRVMHGDEKAIQWAKEKHAKGYNDADLKWRAELKAAQAGGR